MGWMFGYTQVRDVKHQIEHCEGIFTTSMPGHSYEVIDSAIVGNTYYAAVRRITPEAPEGYVFGCVILFRNPKSGFGYKDMDESVGPVEVACPLRILDKLTPLEEMPGHRGYAADWRERVREYHRKRLETDRKARSLKPGDTIRLPNPVRFRNGTTADTFTQRTMLRRGRHITVFETPGGMLCTLPARLLVDAVKIDLLAQAA